MSTRFSLFFTAPSQVEIRESLIPEPSSGQVLVRTLLSAISPGTEMLIYRGQFPSGLSLDDKISALSGGFKYPLKYGYSAVGEVIALGKDVDPSWLGRTVFAFNPHESHFTASTQELLPLPAGITPEQAVFLPNMETAVNFVMDARPMIGERVLVTGQGIVGLLTTALLSRFPLASLVAVDRYELRRQASIRMGAHASLDSEAESFHNQARAILGQEADLCFELSGAPSALNLALSLTGFDGRIIIGSWYGQKRLDLDLGGKFHRSRIRLISSQVSTIAPDLSGRWDKDRRFSLAWSMLRSTADPDLVTHRFPIQSAADAYRLIDERPEQTIQVNLTYP